MVIYSVKTQVSCSFIDDRQKGDVVVWYAFRSFELYSAYGGLDWLQPEPFLPVKQLREMESYLLGGMYLAWRLNIKQRFFVHT